ncbi:MAG: hypothetical protein HY519_02590, partial [Candidatus Aenigmarchaeota archaeon]|nr:hypothetical protein [Candidatus Aenigmarchaeota archaeon]
MGLRAVAILLPLVLLSGCVADRPAANDAEIMQVDTSGTAPPEPEPDAGAASRPMAGKPRPNIYHDGDLIVTGYKLINGSRFTLKGSLIVNGSGRLAVRDAELVFAQDYSQQHTLRVKDDAVLDMQDARLTTDGKWFNFNYQDRAQVRLVGVHGEDCCIPWHSSGDNVKVTIANSTVGLTLSQNASVTTDNSSLFFELVLSNVTGAYRLPKGASSLSMDIKNGDNLMRIRATNSYFSHWGTTLDQYSDVTFSDSALTIGMNAGSDWTRPDPVVKVRGLKAKAYQDFSLAFDTNRLRLINTTVTSWYPQGWNNASVEIADSDLADLQFNGGSAAITVRNSSMSIAIARQDVTYRIYDS